MEAQPAQQQPAAHGERAAAGRRERSNRDHHHIALPLVDGQGHDPLAGLWTALPGTLPSTHQQSGAAGQQLAEAPTAADSSLNLAASLDQLSLDTTSSQQLPPIPPEIVANILSLAYPVDDSLRQLTIAPERGAFLARAARVCLSWKGEAERLMRDRVTLAGEAAAKAFVAEQEGTPRKTKALVLLGAPNSRRRLKGRSAQDVLEAVGEIESLYLTDVGTSDEPLQDLTFFLPSLKNLKELKIRRCTFTSPLPRMLARICYPFALDKLSFVGDVWHPDVGSTRMLLSLLDSAPKQIHLGLYTPDIPPPTHAPNFFLPQPNSVTRLELDFPQGNYESSHLDFVAQCSSLRVLSLSGVDRRVLLAVPSQLEGFAIGKITQADFVRNTLSALDKFPCLAKLQWMEVGRGGAVWTATEVVEGCAEKGVEVRWTY